jgi:hypothetical protein
LAKIKIQLGVNMSNLRTKWGIVLKALIIVLPLVALKAVFHFLGLEVIAVGPVITALVAGVFTS